MTDFPHSRFSQASRTRFPPVLSILVSKPACFLVFSAKFFFFLSFFRSSHSFPGLSGDRGRSFFQSPEEDPHSWNPHSPTPSPYIRHCYSRSHPLPFISSKMTLFLLLIDSRHVPQQRAAPIFEDIDNIISIKISD